MADEKKLDESAKAADLKPNNPPAKPSDKAVEAAAAPAMNADAIVQMATALAKQQTASLAVATPDANKTIPGGRYRNRKGQIVDAENRELNDDGSLKYPERRQMDAFGRLI